MHPRGVVFCAQFPCPSMPGNKQGIDQFAPGRNAMHLNSFGKICILAAAVVSITGAAIDVRSRRIPNWLTLNALVAGLAFHLGTGGFRGFLGSLSAALIAGVLFFVFLLAGGVGAGDLKLMMAVSAISGLHYLPQELLYTVVFGGFIGLLYAGFKGRLRSTFANCFVLISHHKSNGLKSHPVLNVENSEMLRMPYGVFIAMGVIAVFLTAY
jgi:prepilin peptidase CpaA